MAIKTHLYDSAEPAEEGSKLLAICGAIVPDAAFVVQAEWTIKEEIYHMPLCFKCRRRYLKSETTNKYLYVLQSGEEQKQSEAEAS